MYVDENEITIIICPIGWCNNSQPSHYKVPIDYDEYGFRHHNDVGMQSATQWTWNLYGIWQLQS